MILSIIYFFVVTFGLGFVIDFFVKDWDAGFFEKLIVRIGAGVLLIPVLGVIFNHLRIPIHWLVFLLLSSLLLVYNFKKLKLSFSFNITTSNIYHVLIFLIFIVSSYMYISGSFSYSWFEDGDPYKYAITSKYVAIEKTYDVPYYFSHTAYPYAQGYQIFMGLMHQTNNSVYWTMKFFNALIISFSVLFFFYFSKKITNDVSVAFWASFMLASVPAWLSHFVFSFNFNMSLVLLLFYALLSIKENNNWKFVASIFYGSILMNHFYTGVVITGLLIIWFLLSILIHNRINKEYLIALGLGLLISMLFWVPAAFKQNDLSVSETTLGGFKIMQGILQSVNIIYFGFVVLILLIVFLLIRKKLSINECNCRMLIYLCVFFIIILGLFLPSEKLVNVLGLNDKDYSFEDFFWLNEENKIDNPVGIGPVIMSLFFVGLLFYFIRFRSLFEVDNFNVLLVFTLLIFSYFGLAGAKTSISVVPYRFWPFFAIFLVIIAGQGVVTIIKFVNNLFLEEKLKLAFKILVFIFFITSIVYTSFINKYNFNSSSWPEHQIFVHESKELYVWMLNGGLPKNSLVLPLCNNPYVVVGYDMLSLPWRVKSLADDDVFVSGDIVKFPFYKISLNDSLEENYDFLKSQGYNYTILGADCIKRMNLDQELVEKRIQEMLASPRFTLVKSTRSEFLFRIN